MLFRSFVISIAAVVILLGGCAANKPAVNSNAGLVPLTSTEAVNSNQAVSSNLQSFASQKVIIPGPKVSTEPINPKPAVSTKTNKASYRPSQINKITKAVYKYTTGKWNPSAKSDNTLGDRSEEHTSELQSH